MRHLATDKDTFKVMQTPVLLVIAAKQEEIICSGQFLLNVKQCLVGDIL